MILKFYFVEAVNDVQNWNADEEITLLKGSWWHGQFECLFSFGSDFSRCLGSFNRLLSSSVISAVASQAVSTVAVSSVSTIEWPISSVIATVERSVTAVVATVEPFTIHLFLIVFIFLSKTGHHHQRDNQKSLAKITVQGKYES